MWIVSIFFLVLVFLQWQGASAAPAKAHRFKLHKSNGGAYYWLNVFIGTPPQKQSVIIDTGSDITTLPCSDCQTCSHNHRDSFFMFHESHTSHVQQCHQHMGHFPCSRCDNHQRCSFWTQYVEGSTLTGYFRQDYVILSDEEFEDRYANGETDTTPHHDNRVKLFFGCTLSETDMFKQQGANGIMGLGIRGNSTESMPSILDSAYWGGQSHKLGFAICIGEVEGIMTIGDFNTDRHVPHAKVVTLPMTHNADEYTIDVVGVRVGAFVTRPKDRKPIKALFDTGATDTLIPGGTYNGMKRALLKFCSSAPENCGGAGAEAAHKYPCFNANPNQEVESSFYSTFPALQLLIEGTKSRLTWEPRHYLTKFGCLAFQHNKVSEMIILGLSFMMHRDVYFDRELKAISVVESHCSKATKVIHVPPHPHPATTDPEHKEPKEVDIDPETKEPDQPKPVEPETGETHGDGEGNHEQHDNEDSPSIPLTVILILITVGLLMVCAMCGCYLYQRKKTPAREESGPKLLPSGYVELSIK